jgi:hypothetical protein
MWKWQCEYLDLFDEIEIMLPGTDL